MISADTPRTRRRAQVVHIEPAALDLAATAAFLGLSESTVQKLNRDGELPAPRKLSAGRVAWLVAELRAWLAERPVSDLLPPPNTTGRRRADPCTCGTPSGREHCPEHAG